MKLTVTKEQPSLIKLLWQLLISLWGFFCWVMVMVKAYHYDRVHTADNFQALIIWLLFAIAYQCMPNTDTEPKTKITITEE